MYMYIHLIVKTYHARSFNVDNSITTNIKLFCTLAVFNLTRLYIDSPVQLISIDDLHLDCRYKIYSKCRCMAKLQADCVKYFLS